MFENNEYVDHLGNKFNNIVELANAYNLNVGILITRLRTYEMSLETALTTPATDKSVTDHLGNRFTNLGKLCDFHGVDRQRVYARICSGWNIKDAITTPVRGRDYSVKDHLGNTYENFKHLASHYNLSAEVVHRRLKQGYSLESALTIPIHNKFVDPWGNRFEYPVHMRQKYNISKSQWEKYNHMGWDLEYVIMGISEEKYLKLVHKKPSEFKSYWDALDAYNKALESKRISKINSEIFHNSAKCIKDYLGKTYRSRYALAKAYNIDYVTLTKRLEKGWTIRECLLTPKTKRISDLTSFSDTSLNPLIAIHEYSHTAEGTKDRVFRCTIIETGETKYMNENQIKSYPKRWEEDSNG